MKNIYGLTHKELIEYLSNIGEKSYKAEQIYEWLYKKKITTFSQMTNLKKELIGILNNEFTLEMVKLVSKQKSPDTIKYLFKLFDNNTIEAVLMKHDYGNSLCISSQVGCSMGCTFCASGSAGVVRNLEVEEMVCQILFVESEEDIRISSVVVMGIGEPFNNYDNVMAFIRIINEAKGLAIGARHITVSTCGIIPMIDKFGAEGLQVNLALSLHAPSDKIRNTLMPINKVYNVREVINSIKKYIAKTNRRVAIEYVMIEGVNDRQEDALELVRLLKGLNIYINLIPYNETPLFPYKQSSKDTLRKFYDTIKKSNIDVTIRKEYGRFIEAACGMLRSSRKKDN